MSRHTSSLCQSCYEMARPTFYFPVTFRYGTCCACGDITIVARVSRLEAQWVAYNLYNDPHDRPSCCRATAGKLSGGFVS